MDLLARGRPLAFGPQADLARFQVRHLIGAELAEGILRKGLRTRLEEIVRLLGLILLDQDRRHVQPRPGAQRALRVCRDEIPQRLLKPRILAVAIGRSAGPADSLEITVPERGLVLIRAMEGQQLLENPQRPQLRRILLRRLRLPGEELLHRSQRRRVRGNLERINRPRHRGFFQPVVSQRRVREEVIHRRPQDVAQIAVAQQLREIHHRHFLQRLAIRQRLLETRVDLGKDPRQIPALDVFPCRLAGLAALHELPAVRKVVTEQPARRQGPQRRPCLRRGVRQFLVQHLDRCRAAFNPRLGRDPGRQRPRALGPRAVGEGRLLDRREQRDRGLRLILLARLGNLIPLRITRSCRHLAHRQHHGQGHPSEKLESLHDHKRSYRALWPGTYPL